MPRDPYRNFRFEIELDPGFVHAGFQKVTGLSHKVNVVEYREGGENDTPRKLPGQSTFEPVTFERGMSGNSDYADWMAQIFDLDNVGGQPPTEGFRRDVTVYLKDKAGNRVKKWVLINTWPSEHNAGDLDASSSEVLIETLVLQVEGIKQTNLAAA